MPGPHIEQDPAELIEHRAFVRSVVRRLLRDDALTDDIVQETMVRGLSAPRGLRSLRAWLARVGRNLALDELRRKERRARRERAVARPEKQPSAHQLTERLERHRLVVDAVLALPDPFRTTVLLRFYEQLTPARIASLQGVPVATVKSRLRRAMQLLRGDLDRQYGGNRSAWCLALAPLAGLPMGKAAAAATGGLIVMKKLTAAAALIALLATGWIGWNAVREGDDGGATRNTEAARESVSDDSPRKTPAYSTSTTETRTESGHDHQPASTDKPRAADRSDKRSPVEKSATLAETTSDPERAGVRIRVVDAHSRAIADANVSLTLVIGGVGGVGQSGPSKKTDAAGIAFLEDLSAEEVIATHVRVGMLSRRAMLKLTSGRVTELTIAMPEGFVVRGTVRDVDTGAIEGVAVSFSRSLPSGYFDSVYAVTNAEGEYVAEGVPAGKFSVRISKVQRTRTVTVGPDGSSVPEEKKPPRRIQYHERPQGEIEIHAPGPVQKDIVLGKPSVTGTVRDAVTGALLAGVHVTLSGPRYAILNTDEAVAFSVSSLPTGTYRATLKKDGYVIRFLRDIELSDKEVARLEWTIEPGARLEIMLRDPDDKPVTGEHWVEFHPAGAGNWSSNLTADADGRIVSNVVPVGGMTVSVRGGGWKGGPLETVIKAGINKVQITVIQTKAAGGARALSGIVLDASTKRPIKGVRLRIRAGMTMDAYTDATGAFAFIDLPPRAYQVWVQCEGYANQLVKAALVKVGEETRLKLELIPAATVHLRLTDATGRPVKADVHLVYSRKTDPVGRGLRLKTDEDGRVTFRRFPPDEYSLRAIVRGMGRASLKHTIRPGENTIEMQLEAE